MELSEVAKKEKALEVAEAVEAVAEGTQGLEMRSSLFTNLQPQFIVFEVPFVMVLD